MNSASCSPIRDLFSLALIEFISFFISSQMDNSNMKAPIPKVKIQPTTRNKLVKITNCRKKANEYPIQDFVSNGNLQKQSKANQRNRDIRTSIKYWMIFLFFNLPHEKRQVKITIFSIGFKMKIKVHNELW